MAEYCIGTWDMEEQSFTPQSGLDKWYGLSLGELRSALKELRRIGYLAYRYRLDGDYESDPMTLVERVEGRSKEQVLKDWKR